MDIYYFNGFLVSTLLLDVGTVTVPSYYNRIYYRSNKQQNRQSLQPSLKKNEHYHRNNFNLVEFSLLPIA